ncbi:MAG: ribbon-helix-helix domain-containing protein [Pseudolabrys sp.]
MGSTIIKRSIVIGGHKTSVSLEEVFWLALKDIAKERGVSLSDIVADINGRRQVANLSSHLRTYVLDYFRRRVGL